MRLDTRNLDLLVAVYKHLNAEGTRLDLAASLLQLINRLAHQRDDYATYLSLNREQVERDIPYRVVCEARYGGRWDTGTRKRRWNREFNEAERRAASSLFRQAHKWTLRSGVPTGVKMSETAYDLWQKLGDFCASL